MKQEMILRGGEIVTLDPTLPRAAALALAGGRIVALGDEATVRGAVSSRARVIDLGGRVVLPGFTDAHIHFMDWALSLTRLPVGGCASLAGLLELLAGAAAQAPAGTWLTGRGYDETLWPEGRPPTLAELDAAAPGHPVLVFRRDMHLALTNSAGLKAAGIDAATPDPPEGAIGRDPRGRPNGALMEKAINLAQDVIPAPDDEAILAAMAEGVAAMQRMGVTGVHDLRIMGGVCGRPSFRAWQRLEETGRLGLRAWVCLPGEMLEEIVALGLRTGFGGPRLKVGHLKFFCDGSLGARTAWMQEPFLDAGCGMPLTPPDDLAEAVVRAERAGLAVAVHAIGTRALAGLAGAFASAEARRANLEPAARAGLPAAPHRVEHVQMLKPADLARLARLGLVASVQPMHITDDMAVMATAVGPAGADAYRFRQMLDAGITLALGSDAPVSDPNPLGAIHAAVTRQNRKSQPAGGWYPEQRLTVEEALWAHTMGPALAAGRQAELGSLSPGKLADLVVLAADPRRVDPAEIWRIPVVMTICDGQVVHDAGEVS